MVRLRDATLLILVDGDPIRRILLGHKKVRFGAGKVTGIGGGVHVDETVRAATVREMREETGVVVAEADLRPMAQLTFLFPNKPEWDLRVSLFFTDTWTGVPVETEEIAPIWVDVARIPYERMWADATHWLPRALAGEYVVAEYTFGPDCETVIAIREQDSVS